MTKKQLVKLVEESYCDMDLDEQKVNHIASLLKRSELKEYIRQLKMHEKKQSVVITLPFPATAEDRKKHTELFPKKKIIYEIDPSIMVGAKIEDSNLIIEYNLKNVLESLGKFVADDYD